MYKPFFVIVLLTACRTGMAQYTPDTSVRTVTHPDTSYRVVDWKAASVKQAFPYKKLLFPSALVVYGVLALKTDGLQDLNEKAKQEIWTESPHKLVHLDNYLQWAPAVAVYGLNLAGIPGKNNLRDRSMIYGISELIMSSVVFSVKKVSGEWRPNGSDQLSFPSGHTANAFAAAEFLRQEYKGISPWYGVAGYVVAGATGYLRMYNNKHWVGDVVAGAGVGIISTDLAYYIYPYIKRKIFKNRSVSTMVMPQYQNGALGLGLVHTF